MPPVSNADGVGPNLPDDLRLAYRGVRTLVLGATGFVGRWVARQLSSVGADLALPVRDLATARDVFADYGIVGEISRVDLCDPESLDLLVRDTRPAITFNLAGYGVDPVERDERRAYQTNAELVNRLTRSVAGLGSHTWSGQSIVHAGTAMEYGLAGGDLDEATAPQPTTLYARSKLEGTQHLVRDCRTHGLKGLAARLFAVYGPGEAPARLLPTLIDASRRTDPVALTAGAHRRDFVYVEDVAEALLRLGATPDRSGGIVNVATGVLTSIREFAEAAAEILDVDRARLSFGALPTRPEEMHHERVATERLARLTAWRPATSIREGVRRTVLFQTSARGRGRVPHVDRP
jgi:nucleoside-diphosphate-sugar epimerase